MGMNAEELAIVLNATHPHWPTLGKWILPTLLLKPQIIQNRSRASQKIIWI